MIGIKHRGQTLLGAAARAASANSESIAPPSTDATERVRRTEVAIALVEVWVEGFASGEVALEAALRKCQAAAVAARLPTHQKERLLGRATSRILRATPPGKGRENAVPLGLKRIASELIDLAYTDGFQSRPRPSKRPPKVKRPQSSAAAKVASILSDYGVSATARSVEEWRKDYLSHRSTD